MVCTTLYSQTLENDRLALIALYNATNGASWYVKTGWNSPGSPGDNPCGWFGVSCSGSPARVTQLTPFSNNLVGTIPVEIANLTALTRLDLADNKLSGAIPKEIGSMSELTRFSLGLNDLTGTIPSELGNLLNLQDLDLSANDLTGAIPTTLASIQVLKNLLLGNNHLSGTIPAALANMSSLVVVQLGSNELSGAVPDFSGLPLLSMLAINNNKFTFAGMEANTSIGSGFLFNNQAQIPTHFSAGTFSVNPGGTIANQTFAWYRGALLVSTISGSSSYAPASVDYTRTYSTRITHSGLPGITLRSEAITPSEPLPVQLIYFKAKLKDSNAYLSWSTSSEANCKGFEIQKSSDAINYQTIGFRDGGGTTTESTSYYFEDTNLNAPSYYRLKQLDFDGAFHLSDWELVRQGKSRFSIYPNPSVKGSDVTVQLPEGFERYNLMNTRGEFVKGDLVDKSSGGVLQLKGVEAGIYILNVVTKAGIETKKMIIE